MIGINPSREAIAAFQSGGPRPSSTSLPDRPHDRAADARSSRRPRVRVVSGNGAAPARTAGHAAPTPGHRVAAGSKAPGASREHVDGGRGQIEVLLRNPTLPSG
jgi:hypothetical protein